MLSILIVDDEYQTIEGLKRFVSWKELGFSDIFTAYNYREALQIIQSQTIDVLFCDIRMPGESGIELADKTRILKPDIIIVFISAYAEKENLMKAISLKAEAFIEKPIDLEEVNTVLGNLANRLLSGGDHKSFDAQTAAADGLRSAEAISTRVREYIEKHYMNPGLALSDIAGALYVSVPYMCSVFKRCTGVTIKEHINAVRIKKALALLKGSHTKLYEVAQMVGYTNYSYFSKFFKQVTNRNPKDCR